MAHNKEQTHLDFFLSLTSLATNIRAQRTHAIINFHNKKKTKEKKNNNQLTTRTTPSSEVV